MPPNADNNKDAARRKRLWAYSRTNYLKKFYTEEQWQHANRKRELADLTARISQGQAWLATIPRSDPRFSLWSCKVAELRLKRARLLRLDTVSQQA